MTTPPAELAAQEKIDWLKSIPFFAVHLACLFALITGVTSGWVLMTLASYYAGMFGITAGFHRYFSHRAYKTTRVFQFLLALLGTLTMQKGVLWWAANHRHHHRYSDQAEDIHSPTLRGFLWSHIGWILSTRYEDTKGEGIKDFARFPELVWLNKYFLIPPLAYWVLLFAMGGLPWLVWGGVIPTTLLWHGTFTINSLSHVFGSRRYLTTDTSRNNWLLALITCGEGWHNNHHYHQNTANQGWFWWEVDLSYYVLKLFSWVGLVSDLRKPSEATRRAHLRYTAEEREKLKAQSGFELSLGAGAPLALKQ
jgi:stearoyl-CoA desaturase (delta-9 desaturase)